MTFLKKFIAKIKDMFVIPQAPIGLKSMGIRSNYLENVNSFNYSMNRFYTDLLSPVKDPFYLRS